MISRLALPHFFRGLPLRMADEKEYGHASPDHIDMITIAILVHCDCVGRRRPPASEAEIGYSSRRLVI